MNQERVILPARRSPVQERSSLLSSLAQSRLAAAPQPPQRYGLSIMLRKPYPALGHGLGGSGQVDVRVAGADVQRATWEEVPGELREPVRQRAGEDPIVAAHLLGGAPVWRVPLQGTSSVELSELMSAVSTILIDIAPHADISIDEHYRSVTINGNTRETVEAGEDRRGPVSVVVLARVGEGARVRWRGASVGLPGFVFVERLLHIARGAALETTGVCVGAHAVRENMRAVLAGDGASARVKTLFIGSVNNQFDLGVTAEHHAPHTVSDLRAKGVLAGKAQGVYRGLVRVEKHAKGSDGYQRCDAMLLSPTAEVDPIPNLEIETNDVRCTHGVTVSRPDPEQLFYLQSRGLPPAAAQDLLVEGFAGSMLRSYPEQQREQLKKSIHEVLGYA